ncbi:hypothetical protein NQ318_005573 [Aromia moschata]|uniref:Uncharacterized protein n=1 Tax=Aromia moschata TaxID=1265417 RepID=A0AAV8XJF6_9CUCU|nr:hypothetical protein NQ318_005573 [Aromia moschata]
MGVGKLLMDWTDTKYLTVLCCLALGVSARTKDQRTTLEDIERDYLTNQKKSKPNQSSKVAASPSPTHFGFVPTKTLADYVQRDPKPAFAQLQYVPQYQQDDYPQHVAPASQRYTTSFKQYSVPLQQVSRASQKQSPQQALTQAQQVYKYVPQAQAQYPGFEDVQYVTDNSLAQGGSSTIRPSTCICSSTRRLVRPCRRWWNRKGIIDEFYAVTWQ